MKLTLHLETVALVIALGTAGLTGILPIRAQDVDETKNEPVKVEEPVDAPTPAAAESENEDKGHVWRDGKDVVMVGNDFLLKEDETAGHACVVFGNATINGTVTDDLVVVGGSVKVNGRVDGQLVVVMGSLSLGPEAVVNQDAVVVGGSLDRAPGARIGGTPRVVSLRGFFPHSAGLRNWAVHGLMLARPIAPQVGWVWAVVGICLFIYLLIAVLFPRPIQACVDALERRPIASFFMGIMLFVLFAPLMFLLAVSVVGLAVIPFLVCAMVVAFLFGKVSVYRFAGQQLGRQFNSSTLQLPLVAFLIGALIFSLMFTVPVLGFFVWCAIIPFGMGAAALAAFGGLRREGNGKTSVPAPAAVPGAPNPAANPPAGPVMAAPAAGLEAPAITAPVVAAPTPAESASPEPPIVAGAMSGADYISMPRAGFWMRTCATVLDALLFVFVVIITGPKALLLWFVYHVAMWAWKGTTIGGVVVGIKLVRVDGRPVDVGVALVRGAASLFSALAGGLGFFWAGWNREKQSWHDKIAGTIMVAVPKGVVLF